MPRVNLNKKKYVLNDLFDYVTAEMKRQKISQEMMGSKLNMSQQSFCQHIKKQDFKTGDLIQIFSELGTDQDRIGRMMKL